MFRVIEQLIGFANTIPDGSFMSQQGMTRRPAMRIMHYFEYFRSLSALQRGAAAAYDLEAGHADLQTLSVVRLHET